jgi:hypothetical protein
MEISSRVNEELKKINEVMKDLKEEELYLKRFYDCAERSKSPIYDKYDLYDRLEIVILLNTFGEYTNEELMDKIKYVCNLVVFEENK